LYFSRWNEVTPSPPRPAVTSMVVSSTNMERGPRARSSHAGPEPG
jgi:hypothetical protein